MTEKGILDVTRDVVADGFLDEQDVEAILAAARERSEEQPLTTKERAEIMSIVRGSMKGLAFSKLPMPLRILSILLIVTGALGIASGVVTILSIFDSNVLVEALEKVTATTAGVVVVAAICSFVSSSLLLIFAIVDATLKVSMIIEKVKTDPNIPPMITVQPVAGS